LSKKFGTFLKKEKKRQKSFTKRYISKNLNLVLQTILVLVVVNGYIKIKCPNVQNKEKGFDRKSEKNNKTRRTCIA